MKKTNSIRIFFIVTMLLLLCFMIYMVYLLRNSPLEKRENVRIETEIAEETEEILLETSGIPSDAVFILKDCEGYLTVYLISQDMVYLYTDISMDSLPQDLQTEISEGKTFSNTEDLFRFLESYSS